MSFPLDLCLLSLLHSGYEHQRPRGAWALHFTVSRMLPLHYLNAPLKDPERAVPAGKPISRMRKLSSVLLVFLAQGRA